MSSVKPTHPFIKGAKEYYGTTPEGAQQAAKEYQDLFNFFHIEHNLTLTVSEMDDVIHIVKEHIKRVSPEDYTLIEETND